MGPRLPRLAGLAYCCENQLLHPGKYEAFRPVSLKMNIRPSGPLAFLSNSRLFVAVCS